MSNRTMQAVHIRWMIRKDLAEVLNIERDSYQHHWTQEDFERCLRRRNCIGMVAESSNLVVAFYVFELMPSHIHLLNIAVDPEYRSEGIGRRCIDKLKEKLCPTRRKRITANVPETFLPVQKFFAACGFRAVSVLKGIYDESDEDGYRFVYRLTD